MDYFENFQKKYIIIPSQPFNYLFPEESIYITVRSPPGFINNEKEKDIISMQQYKSYIIRFFLESWYPTLIDMPWCLVWIKTTNNFSIITKRSLLWNSSRKNGEIYLGEKKTIATDLFFILENIKIHCEMNAAEFERLLYIISSE